MVNLVNEMSTSATATPPDTLAVANRLRPALLKLTRELRRESHSLGVTGGQVTLLVAIKETPGIGIAGLAARERISVPGMSKAVDRLERAGLVVRTPSGADRRRVGLRLTADGERVLRSVKSKRTAWLAERLRRLDPDQLEALDAAVEPLVLLLGERA
jgi:DNA-binding MarR family transcriptional regulator